GAALGRAAHAGGRPAHAQRAPLRARALTAPSPRLLLVTALALVGAYQVARPQRVEMGSSPLGGLLSRGVYPAEADYRWTSGHAPVSLAGPGSGRQVRVVATVSAWRPRGTTAPELRVAAEDSAVSAAILPAPADVTIAATTRRPWSGAVEVTFDSPTLVPGPGDPRALGVRLHAITLAPAPGAWAPGLPPLLPVLWMLTCVQLAAWTAGAARFPTAAASRAGSVAAGVAVLVVVFARTWTVLLPAVAAAEAIAIVVAWLAPRSAAGMSAILAEAARRLRGALPALGTRAVVALAALGAVGATLAYRAHPVIEIPMGSGRETAFEEGLG